MIGDYYEDSNWKDKLTKRVNQTITYDESGNPLSYLGATLTWKNGRQLASYTKGTTNVTYEYNESGLRTQKTVNKNGTITTYNYIWSDDRLTHQSWDNKYLHFYYDNSGEIVGFEYFDGTSAADYTYMKNMQGDVLCIVDDTGARVAQYSYDAWGKLNTFSGGIGLINPIRYRGYYYDTEISMYYLQSRYYNPAVGRFINADDVDYIGSSENILSYNIFAYCENCPIFYVDPSGYRIQINCSPFNKNGKSYTENTIKNWLSKISGRSLKLVKIKNGLFEVNHGNIRDIDRKPKRSDRAGLRLIYDILRSDKVVTIDFNKLNESSKSDAEKGESYSVVKGIPTNAVVIISSDKKRIIVYKNNKYIIAKQPLYISLAHELIHAYLIIRGKAQIDKETYKNAYFSKIKAYFENNQVKRLMTATDKSFYKGYLEYGYHESKLEMQVIGMEKYSPLNGITENAIRKENGLAIRVSHFGY